MPKERLTRERENHRFLPNNLSDRRSNNSNSEFKDPISELHHLLDNVKLNENEKISFKTNFTGALGYGERSSKVWFEKKLNQNHINSFLEYVRSSKDINNHARNPNLIPSEKPISFTDTAMWDNANSSQKETIWKNEKIRLSELINHLEIALSTIKTKNTFEVFRRVDESHFFNNFNYHPSLRLIDQNGRIRDNILSEIEKQIKDKPDFFDPGFVSTSLSKSPKGLSQWDSHPILFEITLPKGSPAAFLRKEIGFVTQNEMLITRNQKFSYKEIYKIKEFPNRETLIIKINLILGDKEDRMEH